MAELDRKDLNKRAHIIQKALADPLPPDASIEIMSAKLEKNNKQSDNFIQDVLDNQLEPFSIIGDSWSASESHLKLATLQSEFPMTWRRCCMEAEVMVSEFSMEDCLENKL